MALVKLSHGAAVNPDSFKYISIEAKQMGGKVMHTVKIKIDDNSEHWIAAFDDKQEAIDLVREYAKRINSADD